MRKSLIVGLGGTGAEICTWLADRIIWEYGDLKRAPFVDFLVVDTSLDKIQKTALDSANYFHHAQISKSEIASMAKNPHDYDHVMGFSQWYNPQVLGTQDISNGTQGVRMLGRMALLLPSNYNKIYSKLNAKIKALSTLEPVEVQNLISDGFNQRPRNISFLPKVHVYVLATACGGTGCGTWVDFAYILRQVQQAYGDAVVTVGIITLPSINETDARKKANAYALLTELNHFSTNNNRFDVQYPGHPKPHSFYTMPYDFPYLTAVDVTRVDKGGLRNANELNQTIGQYLFSDIFYDRVAGIRDGRRDDILQYFISPDQFGLTQKYMTLGISFLQYPVERIIRGCTHMLLTQAFNDWRADHTGAVPKDTIGSMGLDTVTLGQRLMEAPSGSISDRINRQLDNVATNYSSPNELEEIDRNLKLALETVTQNQNAIVQAASPALPHGYIPAVAAANCIRVADDCKLRLTRHIEQALFNISYGPSYCLGLLKALRQALEAQHNSSAPTTVADTTSDMRHAFSVLKGIQEDGLQHFPISFSTHTQAHWVEVWIREAKSYYNSIVVKGTIEAQKFVIAQIIELVKTYELRLANFDEYMRHGQSHFEEEWKTQDKAFQINGKLLYEPGSLSKDDSIKNNATLTKEYREKLGKTSPEKAQIVAESAVKAKVINDIRIIGFSGGTANNDLLAATGKSFFDATDRQRDRYQVLRSDDEKLCIETSQPYFESVRETNVIEAFAEAVPQDQWGIEIANLFALSEWFLPVQINTPGFSPESIERKYRHWAFYPGADDQRPSPQLKAFQQTVLNKKPDENIEIHQMDEEEPYSAVFLSEFGAFPLRIVNGLTDWRSFALQVMGLHGEHNSIDASGRTAQIPTVYTQEHIPWVAFTDTDRMGREQMEELFLVGIALDEITKDVGSTSFVFQPANEKPLSFSNNIHLSARTLYDANPIYANTLKSRIQAKRQGGERDTFLITQLFDDFLSGKYQTLGLQDVVAGKKEDQIKELRRLLRNFTKRPGNEGLDNEFKKVHAPRQDYNYLYHNMGDPIDPSYAEGPKYPDTGYYCDLDHFFFGNSVPPSCPSCGNDLYRFE